MYNPLRIVANAQSQLGPCADCPAACPDTEGAEPRAKNVHPGYYDYESADIMFVGISTSHETNPDWYRSMRRYNIGSGGQFLGYNEYGRENGGRVLMRTLQTIPGQDILDTWVTDAIKCPAAGEIESDEWDNCQQYLAEELNTIDPAVVVALGGMPRAALLEVLDESDLEDELHDRLKKDIGRLLQTNPTIVSATHWSHNHLAGKPHPEWGRGWADSVDYLSRDTYETNVQILQDALAHAHSMSVS